MSILNYTRFLLLLAILSFVACKQTNPQLQEQLVAIQSQLDLTNAELNQLKSKPVAALVHCVFFQLKSDLSEAEKSNFITELKSLSKISYTQNLFVAQAAETGDARLKKDYDLVLQMSFSSLEDLAKYQKHEHHLKVKAAVGSSLAAKPFVYDYWRK